MATSKPSGQNTSDVYQSGPIAVYGATGYTGKLIAAELQRRGADFILAGRNAEKLEQVAVSLDSSSEAEIAVVDINDRAGLAQLLERCSTVIACAGPFSLHGRPILAAAAETGTHYVDTTGEQPFIRSAFDDFAGRARVSGAALVSAMGFDYAPGDFIASLTADGMGHLDELALAYSVAGFEPSHGTALSALEMMKGGDVEWRDGALHPAPSSTNRGSWDFPEPIGTKRMVRYPAGEQITVPRHIDTDRVRTIASADTMLPPPLDKLAAGIVPAFGLAARSPIRRGIEAAISRLPEGAEEASRQKVRFTVDCIATKGNTSRRGTVSGVDVYGITAKLTVHGALLMSSPGYDRSGALAPSQAYDPAEFLNAMAEHGVSYEVEPLTPVAG